LYVFLGPLLQTVLALVNSGYGIQLKSSSHYALIKNCMALNIKNVVMI